MERECTEMLNSRGEEHIRSNNEPADPKLRQRCERSIYFAFSGSMKDADL